jgi:hypothetical protein
MELGMLRFYVDYNFCEERDAIVLRLDTATNAHITEEQLTVGERVVLFDEGDEY